MSGGEHTPAHPWPVHLDLKKDAGLTIEWSDGLRAFYPIGHLRRWSPSADMRELRKAMGRNPLTVLPSGGSGGAVLRATTAELIGNYAIRVEFSDGHRTGIYTWEYLRRIDPERMTEDPDGGASPHADPLALGPG
jgi:DUF971 family protein